MAATMMRLFSLIVCVGLHSAAVAQSVDAELVPPTPEEARDIATWIDRNCCWSNNCCRKVKPTALHPLSRDQYRVVATGQIVPRTDWSRDGNTWRCTCDQNEEGRWVVHLKANTRCIFPVPQGY